MVTPSASKRPWPRDRRDIAAPVRLARLLGIVGILLVIPGVLFALIFPCAGVLVVAALLVPTTS